MSENRFSDWANRRGGGRSIIGKLTQPAPAQASSPALIRAEVPRTLAVQVAPQLFVPQSTEPAQTCMILPPGDRDPYAELLAGLPELVADNLGEGVDAMQLGGVPNAARTERWTPTMSRAYGGDNRRSFEQHLRDKYKVTTASLRDTRGMTVK